MSRASSSEAPTNRIAWKLRRTNELYSLTRSWLGICRSSRHCSAGNTPVQKLWFRYNVSRHRVHTWANVRRSYGVKYWKKWCKNCSSCSNCSIELTFILVNHGHVPISTLGFRWANITQSGAERPAAALLNALVAGLAVICSFLIDCGVPCWLLLPDEDNLPVTICLVDATRDGFSGAPIDALLLWLLPPHNAFVTRSMTLVLPWLWWCFERRPSHPMCVRVFGDSA